MQAIFVYVTCKDRQEATTIGKAVVEARLAACANILDGMASIYWWEGRLETSNEAVLIFKTSENLLDSLTSKVKSLHSYSVPCVVACRFWVAIQIIWHGLRRRRVVQWTLDRMVLRPFAPIANLRDLCVFLSLY